MHEHVPTKSPGDNLYAAEVNTMAAVTNRMGRMGGGKTAIHTASFYGDCFGPPWQQYTVEIKSPMKDEKGKVIAGRYLVYIHEFDFKNSRWITSKTINDGVLELDATSLGTSNRYSNGELLVCWWDDQRGTFVPINMQELIPFELSTDLAPGGAAAAYLLGTGWAVSADASSPSELVTIRDRIGCFRGIGKLNAGGANGFRGWCRKVGDDYVVVMMRPIVHCFTTTVLSSKVVQPHDRYVPLRGSPDLVNFPPGGGFGRDQDYYGNNVTQANNLFKQTFRNGDTVVVFWNEGKAVLNQLPWDAFKVGGSAVMQHFHLMGELQYQWRDTAPFATNYLPHIPDARGRFELNYSRAIYYPGGANPGYVGLPRMHANKFVTAMLDPESGAWQIVETPQINYVGVLNGSLQGGMGMFRGVEVASGGHIVTVDAQDHFMKAGQTLEGGSKVKIEWFDDDQVFRIMGAVCD